MKRIIILVVALLILIGGCVGFTALGSWQVDLREVYLVANEVMPEETEPMAIFFSQSDTFYDKDISVSITCADSSAKLYYTTDGTTPSVDEKLYTKPIQIKAKSTITATTLKVLAVDGETSSEIITKSYVTGKGVFERFDENTLVFVLSTDPYNLNDYYYGVATEGYERDKYLASDDYEGGEVPYNAPANWYLSGRESERDMYVEVYDSNGKKLLEQAAGARVVGGYSRANAQKSWRLIARNSYSEGNGKFKYAFFDGATDADGELITRYDRITLRNNANDREFASIRDEVSMQLAENAGFDVFQETRPAAVFLNGEYYGFSWLHEAYDESYLETEFGGNKDNYQIVDGKESEVDGEEQAVADYGEVLALLETDLTDDASFNKLCELVDMDSLMLYYAIQVYIDNKDWPGNNFKAYRYYQSADEEITSKYQDGKWRYMLFDAEYAWGLYGNGYKDYTLSNVLSGSHMQGASAMLKALLERDDMKERFSNTICDLISGAFAPKKALQVIEDKIAECDSECMYALLNGYTSDWANPDSFADSRKQVRDFAEKRPKIMYRDLIKTFEIPEEEQEMYTITVNNPTGGIVHLNSQKLDSTGALSGQYFVKYSVPVYAEAASGYEFAYWEINGVRVDGNTLTLDSSICDSEGKIELSLYLNKLLTVSQPIEITAAGNGLCTIANNNDVAINTKGFYLSDKEDKLNKFALPSLVINAKSAAEIAFKNARDSEALLKVAANFKLKAGETLYLSDSDGKIISSFIVAAE